MKSPVVLINVFAVPEGKEDEFLKAWHATAEGMKNQPGFISTKLHRSLKPDARFEFINVALWESSEAYLAATSHNEPREKQLSWLEANPALYTVEAEY